MSTEERNQEISKKAQKRFKTIYLIIGSVIGCFLLIGFIGSTAKKKEPEIEPWTYEVPKEVQAADVEEPKEELPVATETQVLMAGEHIVGTDLPPGRYVATNIGRGTNFFVYKSTGRLKVNTVLGNGSIGSGDYKFWAEDGDRIETRGKVKLIPAK